MGMTSTISEKGQVTIPKALRDTLAWAPGTVLEFVEHNGTLVVRNIAASDPIAALVGLLPRMNVDEAVVELRGPGWDDAIDGGRSGHGGR